MAYPQNNNSAPLYAGQSLIPGADGFGQTDFTTPLLNYGQNQQMLGAGYGQNMQGMWPHQAPTPNVNFNQPGGYGGGSMWDGFGGDLAGYAGTFSNVLKGIGSGVGAYTALMNYKAGNKQLKHTRNLQNKNYQAAAGDHNRQIEDLQKMRVASSRRSAPGDKYESVSSYMDKNRIT